MPSTPSNKEYKIHSFWDRYIQKHYKSVVNPPFDRWRVMRADQYLAVHPGRRLTEQGSAGVGHDLTDLDCSPSLKGWQFHQAVAAIKNLVVLAGAVWLETAS